jgi:hypothetical protein
VTETDQRRTYSFGPLERRGVVGGLRAGQVVCLAAGSVGAVVVVRAHPTPASLMIALVAVVIAALTAFLPVAGRPLEAWAGIVGEWLLDGLRSNHRFRASRPFVGARTQLDGPPTAVALELPPALSDCRLIAVPIDGQDLGVIHDGRTRALTAVIAVRIRSVGLLATSEHEARLARWGQVLASLARSGSTIRRLQVLQRALPGDAQSLWRHYLSGRVEELPEESDLDRSYMSLLDETTQVTQNHEVLLAVQVDERRAWARAARDAALRSLSREGQAHSILLRELRTLASRLDKSDVEIAGLLTAEQYARALRHAFDPYRSAVEATALLPVIAAETAWDRIRCDGAWHRTYWIAQWPRLPVGPLFMTPLLLGAHAVHSVSVLIEPVSPARSRRSVEAAITSDEADEELRQRRGFRTTATRRRQQDATRQREEELASGHEEIRLAGYVTVTGRTDSELDAACERVEQAAQQAYLDLQPLWGEQEAGFVNGALPVGRGLRAGRLL